MKLAICKFEDDTSDSQKENIILNHLDDALFFDFIDKDQLINESKVSPISELDLIFDRAITRAIDLTISNGNNVTMFQRRK